MSFSDEPIVIKDSKRSKKKPAIFIGLLVLLFALLASIIFYPRWIDYRRAHAPRGPLGGNLYNVSLAGDRFTMELARGEDQEYRASFHLTPVREETTWVPMEHEIVFRLENTEDEFERLSWNPEINGFGYSELQYNPIFDYVFEIRVERRGETVWSGTRWSFRQVGGGHGGHGHAH